MLRNLDRDDRDFDALLRGRVPADRPDLDSIALVVSELRTAAITPAPPNAALAAVLAAGLPAAKPAAVPVSHRRLAAPGLTWAAAVTWARSLRTAAKAGLIALVAVFSFTTAAVAGVLPGPLQQKVAAAVETVTPWAIPHPDRSGVGKLVREKARHHGQDKSKHTSANEAETSESNANANGIANGNGNGIGIGIGNGIANGSSGKPASPGKSEMSKANKPAAVKPSHAATPAKPAHPTKAATSRPALAPKPAPGKSGKLGVPVPASPRPTGSAKSGAREPRVHESTIAPHKPAPAKPRR